MPLAIATFLLLFTPLAATSYFTYVFIVVGVILLVMSLFTWSAQRSQQEQQFHAILNKISDHQSTLQDNLINFKEDVMINASTVNKNMQDFIVKYDESNDVVYNHFKSLDKSINNVTESLRKSSEDLSDKLDDITKDIRDDIESLNKEVSSILESIKDLSAEVIETTKNNSNEVTEVIKETADETKEITQDIGERVSEKLENFLENINGHIERVVSEQHDLLQEQQHIYKTVTDKISELTRENKNLHVSFAKYTENIDAIQELNQAIAQSNSDNQQKHQQLLNDLKTLNATLVEATSQLADSKSAERKHLLKVQKEILDKYTN